MKQHTEEHEELLMTLDQLGQTIEVMTQVIHRLRLQIDERNETTGDHPTDSLRNFH